MKGFGLRVGLVAPRFVPFRGGMETYTEQAARALAARGVEVTVVTQVPRCTALASERAHNGFMVERYPLPFGGSFDIPSLAAVRAATHENRFDVVWAHSYHTPLAWMVAERAGVPFVLTPHYHGTGHTRLRALLHRPYRLLGRRLLAASRRIVVDTEAEAGLLRRDFPRQVAHNKVAVVPLSVPNPVHGRPYAENGPVVLTVARQEPYKRTDLLIHAVAELQRRGVLVRLVVVGDGPALVASRRLAAQLRLQERIVFTGLIDDDRLGRWWASAALYATASEQEAFGITLAQALVAGLGVVASAIPAHHEVHRRAGSAALAKLVTEDSPRNPPGVGYADAIEQLLMDRRHRETRANACTLPTPMAMADQLLEELVSAMS